MPIPPGSATNASLSSAISALRSCIELDDVQLGQAGVRDLAVDEHLRDDADDLAAGGQRGVGERAHQTDGRAAVDDADAALGQRRCASCLVASRYAGSAPKLDPQ